MKEENRKSKKSGTEQTDPTVSAITMTRAPLIWLVLTWVTLISGTIEAFQFRIHSGIPTSHPSSVGRTTTDRQALFKEEESSKSFLFQDNAKTIRVENDAHADDIHKQEDDGTSKLFSVGDVVRVILPDLRAYQVPTKARGTFQEGTFVADDSLKYMVIPIGLTGTIEKVYDEGTRLSANLPIRVSFPSSSGEDGPESPVAFSMYFAPPELELVQNTR